MISLVVLITLVIALFIAAGRYSTPKTDRTPITSWGLADLYYNCRNGLDLFAPTVHYPNGKTDPP